MWIDWRAFFEMLRDLLIATLLTICIVCVVLVDMVLWYKLNPFVCISFVIVEIFLILLAFSVRKKNN